MFRSTLEGTIGKRRVGRKDFSKQKWQYILLKGLWDDWGQGWQTVTGAFLGFVKDILSANSFTDDLWLLWCRIAELRHCSAELYPQRPYGPIGSPKIFVLFFFLSESACWNLKEREGDKKRGMWKGWRWVSGQTQTEDTGFYLKSLFKNDGKELKSFKQGSEKSCPETDCSCFLLLFLGWFWDSLLSSRFTWKLLSSEWCSVLWRAGDGIRGPVLHAC